jgi:Fe-S oxidoreductase
MKRFTALKEQFEKDRRRVLEDCLACGMCFRLCPSTAEAMPFNDAVETQRAICEFLENPSENEAARMRALSCMECFGCLEACPMGLNPMRIMQIVRSLLDEHGLAEIDKVDPKAPGSPHRRVLAESLSEEERRAVLNPSARSKARYVLFPGCNVYKNPELLLAMRKVMDAVADDWTFMPGLADCCGGWRLSAGDAAGAEASWRRLVSRASGFKPESLVLWCPTCLCNFKTVYTGSSELPFRTVSFFQLLAEKIGELDLQPVEATVTLHEPCKTAFTGLDESHRKVMAAIPGLELVEMPRHGRETACCGWGLLESFPEAGEAYLKSRLEEAEATGADKLVTVCHSCKEVFEQASRPQPVDNLLLMVAKSLGIESE